MFPPEILSGSWDCNCGSSGLDPAELPARLEGRETFVCDLDEGDGFGARELPEGLTFSKPPSPIRLAIRLKRDGIAVEVERVAELMVSDNRATGLSVKYVSQLCVLRQCILRDLTDRLHAQDPRRDVALPQTTQKWP